MSDYDDMTDAELEAKADELKEDIQCITEQIGGTYELKLGVGEPETRYWLFRAIAARKYRRTELCAICAELKARKRAVHVDLLVHSRFVKTARQFLPPAQFDKIMDRAKSEASLKLDANGAPVKQPQTEAA